jgi:hypothetical protein
LVNSAVLAGGLSQASGSAGGIICSMGAAFGGLSAASTLSESHLTGVTTGLVIAAVASLAWPNDVRLMIEVSET